MKVTDLPSGQWLVWPLQIFMRSGTASAETELALLDTTARSRAAAKDTPAVAMNTENIKALRKNTLAPAKDKFAHFEILVEFGQGLNGQEGHVPLELTGVGCRLIQMQVVVVGWQECAHRVG